MPKQLWLPKKAADIKTEYSASDRPELDVPMLYDHVNNTYTHRWTDHYTGKDVNFGRDLSGSDNKMSNLSHCWLHDSGYAQTTGYCARDHYISWHLGAIPDLHTKSSIKSFKQHMLPSYIGLRFKYRWPDTNDRNYWSVSPVHINDLMIHYYNQPADEIWSYAAQLDSCSISSPDFWPDRYASNSSRRSDSWKGCFWCPPDAGAINEIRNNQLFMIGASFEMKYTSYKTASHSRCMDICNMTPIWDQGSGNQFVPVLGKPRTNTWIAGSALELYTI